MSAKLQGMRTLTWVNSECKLGGFFTFPYTLYINKATGVSELSFAGMFSQK